MDTPTGLPCLWEGKRPHGLSGTESGLFVQKRTVGQLEAAPCLEQFGKRGHQYWGPLLNFKDNENLLSMNRQ